MNLYLVAFEKYNEDGEYLGNGRVSVEAQHCSQAALMVESQATAVVDVTRVQGNIPTKKHFDEVYATGYVYLVKSCGPPADDEWVYTTQLEGEFTTEALQVIIYAMNNHPEWFKLDDQT